MLNEKRIFSGLTTGGPTNCPYLRFHTLNGKNKPSVIGLSYIFTTLARGFLFDNTVINKICNNDEKDNRITNNKIQLCICLLNIWCGFSEIKNKNNDYIFPDFLNENNKKDIVEYINQQNIDGFLKNWFENHTELTNLKNTIYGLNNTDSGGESNINTSISYESYNKSNPYHMQYKNQISFPRSISSAIDLGPLKEYYLVCKNKLYADANDNIDDKIRYQRKSVNTLNYVKLSKKNAYANEYTKFVAFIALNKMYSTDCPNDGSVCMMGYEFYIWCQETIKKPSALITHYWHKQTGDDYAQIAYSIDDSRFGLNHKWLYNLFPIVISSSDYHMLLNKDTPDTHKKNIVPYYKSGYYVYTESENLNIPLQEISNPQNQN